MRIDILTLFPPMFKGPFTESILKRAQEKKILKINIHNVRDFTKDKHHTVDDRPFGGGTGMIMKPEPLFEAVDFIKSQVSPPLRKIILMCPQGKTYTQTKAKELSKEKHLIFICGHYEGVDERVRECLATEEISIGDYILTGGELACMVVIDALARLVPGVLAKEPADSFSDYLLDYPQYTRPSKYKEMKIPTILLSGNHQEISRWRRRETLRRTFLKRPDLLKKSPLSKEDRKILAKEEEVCYQAGRGQDAGNKTSSIRSIL